MTDIPLASFLLPDGFARPAARALLHESSIVGELGRFAVTSRGERRRRRALALTERSAPRAAQPVLLVPGFMAGDGTLSLMARALRARGYRTYRSHIGVNVGCTLDAAQGLERRLEAIVARRDSRVQIVGHSLGGMLARGVAVRRPDLVSGIVTLGSPMLAPGAHHPLLSMGVEGLLRLSRAGFPGVMAEDCVAGSCARESFDESRQALAEGVSFTAVYSRRDGIVDWRACIDPLAVQVEVTASHCGLAVDPRVIDVVTDSLQRHLDAAAGLSALRIA